MKLELTRKEIFISLNGSLKLNCEEFFDLFLCSVNEKF